MYLTYIKSRIGCLFILMRTCHVFTAYKHPESVGRFVQDVRVTHPVTSLGAATDTVPHPNQDLLINVRPHTPFSNTHSSVD